jgi:anti-sigma regulatory factor (Ser/Thr protein kinase)
MSSMRDHEVFQLPSSIAIRDEADVYSFASMAKHLALQLGFTDFQAGLIFLAASEIAMNSFRHAKHGVAIIQVTDNNRGIGINVEDQGPGIGNLELAMKDGFSTRLTLGLGLGAARRSMDEFLVKSSASGTSVTMSCYLPVPRELIDTGMVSFPVVGGDVNGDAYLIKGYEGDKMLTAIFDGAGKGIQAAKSAELVKKEVLENYKLPLDELVRLCHEKLVKYQVSRGVEVALLRITPDSIESLIMGNTSIQADSTQHLNFSFHDGSIGIRLPDSLTVQRRLRPDQFTVVMHSDGIKDINYASCNSDDVFAQRLAEQIFDQYAVTDDDATVIAIKG